MDSIISLLKDTPIPTILVLSGIVFLFLALAGQIAGKLEIPPTRQKWAAAAGAVFLGAGLLLYLAPGLPRFEAAQASPQQTPIPPVMQASNTEGNTQAPSAQPAASAAPLALGEGGACLEGFFTNIAAERVVKVESGKRDKELLGSHQTKKEPAGILLVDLGQPLLALTYSIVEEDELVQDRRGGRRRLPAPGVCQWIAWRTQKCAGELGHARGETRGDHLYPALWLLRRCGLGGYKPIPGIGRTDLTRRPAIALIILLK